jgi:hypothetical protein
MVGKDTFVTYTSEIIDGGDGPKFQVTPSDGEPIVSASCTGCWTTIVKGARANKAVNKLRDKDHSNSASGPDYFGLSHNTIMKLIQDMPNATKCQQYKSQTVSLLTSLNSRAGGNQQRGAVQDWLFQNS